ncbi:MAG: transcriptional regulator [Chloroflexi bacterium]|nr:transcriptional regulator [Chloroflexota bacterium]
MKEDVVVDNLDSQIVQILKNDGRASNAHIARALGVSEGTVRRRLKMLIDGGVVHVNVSLDPAKMGLTTEAIIGLEVDPDKMDPVCASIAAFDEIGYVTLTTGAVDVFAWGRFSSTESLGLFLRSKVGKIPGVRRTETYMCISVRKDFDR